MLQGWTHEWSKETMYAGVGAQGAEDAWYMAALNVEDLITKGVPYCGGTADIQKLFDQIPRQMVYWLCERAGMPNEKH